MIMKRFKKIFSCVLSLALTLTCMISLGCSNTEKTVCGWVYADDSVSSAVLSIYDKSGNQILKSDNLITDAQGAILIDTAKLPSDFKIITEGGTLYGEAFTAELSADIRNYNAETDTIYINLTTTIISAYLDKHPEAGLMEASLAVKNFLEVPESLDLSSGTQLTSEYFNNSQFLTEANESGGINSFIEQLLVEMDAGETHPFQKPLMLQSAASWLATTLAEGAVSYVGGELMGWGLDKAGINFGEEDLTPEELAKIQEGMTEMKTEMSKMSIQLDAISDKLDNIVLQLKDMLKQLSHQQALSDYGNRVLQLNDLISSIYSIQRDLNSFISNPPANPEAARQRLIERIASNIIDHADVIHNQLVGLAGEKPLLTLWREIVYEDRYLDSDDYDKIKSQYDFFKQYQDAILLLQVEYYHAIEEEPGENESIIMDCINRYESHLEQQEALLTLPIEKNTVVDTKWDGMYYSENIEFGKSDDTFTLNGKTQSQVTTYMSELAGSNYAGFEDWEALDYDSIGALIENHIQDRTPWNWSEFMVSQGWPGVTVDNGVVVPFYKVFIQTKFVYMLNDSSHFDSIFDFPQDEFKNSGSTLIMVYRSVTADDYGYAHLKG